MKKMLKVVFFFSLAQPCHRERPKRVFKMNPSRFKGKLLSIKRCPTTSLKIFQILVPLQLFVIKEAIHPVV